MNHAHTVSGMRIRVMPLARRSSVVVMKFSAPINDASAEDRDAGDPQVGAQTAHPARRICSALSGA